MASFFVVGVMWTLARTPAVKGSSHHLVKLHILNDFTNPPDPKNLHNLKNLFSRNNIHNLSV